MAAATSGIVASSQAAVIYDESIGGDLSNSSGTPTVLTSGTDTVIGSMNDGLSGFPDRDDHFVIVSLSPGGTAVFDYTYDKGDDIQDIEFSFSDPAGGTPLFTTGSITSPEDGGGSTPSLTVPGSGQIRVSVRNTQTAESGTSDIGWTVSTADVVPEPSSSAIVALGSLLVLRRRR